MIGSDKENVTELFAGFVDGANGLIAVFHCLDSSFINTGMSNHVRIRKIENNKWVFARFECFNSLLCDAVDTHFPAISNWSRNGMGTGQGHKLPLWDLGSSHDPRRDTAFQYHR